MPSGTRFIESSGCTDWFSLLRTSILPQNLPCGTDSGKPWTDQLWIYDLRTNQHFTLKTNTLKADALQDFIKSYNPDNRRKRRQTDRFKPFSYADLLKRDKVNLDIFWLKDDALEDSANLPSPDLIAQEIVDDLEAALEQFRAIEEDLK